MIDGPETVVPDRDVQYRVEGRAPQWKIDWDQARSLYHQGKLGQALVQYELVLQQKKTVDEARWEYVSLLIQQNRLQQAGTQLDILLHNQPENRNYLFARAQVFLEEGNADQAMQLYGRLYQEYPASTDADKALRGLIAALDALGNKEAQLPLLEQLLVLKPVDLTIVKKAGALALALGKNEKTLDVLAGPLKDHPKDCDMLRLVALAQENLGHLDLAAALWQQIVALDATHIEANSWLASYYQLIGNNQAALDCMGHLLQVTPSAPDLLLTTARIYTAMARPGQALDYYALYLDFVPEAHEVIKERDRTRQHLALTLVSLVENKKVEELWQDLQKVTGDGEGVYLQMADLLKKQGKDKALADVLMVLHKNRPEDQRIYFELIPLLEAQGRYEEIENL